MRGIGIQDVVCIQHVPIPRRCFFCPSSLANPFSHQRPWRDSLIRLFCSTLSRRRRRRPSKPLIAKSAPNHRGPRMVQPASGGVSEADIIMASKTKTD